MHNKTKQLLAYIVKNYPRISITSLMKLSYLIDLVNVGKRNKKISNFEYIRYKYGPFDYKIYDYVKDLLKENIIIQDTNLSFPEDYFVYEFNEENDGFSFELLKDEEKETIKEVLNSLVGLGARALTEIAYKTKPMIKLKAKLNNNNGLNEKLDLYVS